MEPFEATFKESSAACTTCGSTARLPSNILSKYCTRCQKYYQIKMKVSRGLQKKMRQAKWTHLEFPQNLLDAMEGFGLTHNSPDEQVLKQLILALGQQRVHSESKLHFRSSFELKGGFASSNFKSKASIKNALKKNFKSKASGNVMLRLDPDEWAPSSLGKITETELGFRCGISSKMDFSKPSKTPSSTHPSLGLTYFVSRDGTVISESGPMTGIEVKTTADLEKWHKLVETVHQMALQAFEMGIDEGLLILMERPLSNNSTTLRFTSVVVGNLLEFHTTAVDSWLASDTELLKLVNGLGGRTE